MEFRSRAILGILMVACVTTAQLLVGVLSQDASCLTNLIACQSYLISAKPPSKECCVALRETVNNQLPCLCNLRTSDQFKQFGAKGLNIVGHCEVDISDDRCKNFTAPAPGPSDQKSKENHGNRLIGISGSMVLVWFLASLLM